MNASLSDNGAVCNHGQGKPRRWIASRWPAAWDKE